MWARHSSGVVKLLLHHWWSGLAPGTYNERLEIDKPVDIVGTGSVGAVTIQGVDGPVIQISGGRVACRIARLRIVQRAATEGVPMSGAVRVEGGGVLVLEECAVASSSGHCVVIKGADSCGYILHNEVRPLRRDLPRANRRTTQSMNRGAAISLAVWRWQQPADSKTEAAAHALAGRPRCTRARTAWILVAEMLQQSG